MRQPVDKVFSPIPPGGRIAYHRLVLRGCSQLCFQSNELTGLCFLAAALIFSPLAAAYFLVAALIAPGGRMLLGERGQALAAGLPGLNPCLIALSLPVFFDTGWTNVVMWAVLIVCIAVTVVLVRLLVAVLPFPILAFPFLVIFWSVYAAAPYLPFLQRKSLAVTDTSVFHPVVAVLSSLGEAVFAPGVWSGVLFLTGLLLSNWRHAAVAAIGAAIGTSVSYYYHAVDPAAADLGLYGFNAVLTAVAVFALCGNNLRLAILGALVATIMMPAIAGIGLQPVSAPLVFTTWLILALGWFDEHWFSPPDTTKENCRAETQ